MQEITAVDIPFHEQSLFSSFRGEIHGPGFDYPSIGNIHGFQWKQFPIPMQWDQIIRTGHDDDDIDVILYQSLFGPLSTGRFVLPFLIDSFGQPHEVDVRVIPNDDQIWKISEPSTELEPQDLPLLDVPILTDYVSLLHETFEFPFPPSFLVRFFDDDENEDVLTSLVRKTSEHIREPLKTIRTKVRAIPSLYPVQRYIYT